MLCIVKLFPGFVPGLAEMALEYNLCMHLDPFFLWVKCV